MASRKRDTCQIEPKTYVLFRLCLNRTMNWKTLKNFVIKEMFLADNFPSI